MPGVVGADVAAYADPVRSYAARSTSEAMGSREQNFHNQLAYRMGYEREACDIQDLYLDRRYDEAAAVPHDFIDRTSLLGPTERIAERSHFLAASGVTTVNVARMKSASPT